MTIAAKHFLLSAIYNLHLKESNEILFQNMLKYTKMLFGEKGVVILIYFNQLLPELLEKSSGFTLDFYVLYAEKNI